MKPRTSRRSVCQNRSLVLFAVPHSPFRPRQTAIEPAVAVGAQSLQTAGLLDGVTNGNDGGRRFRPQRAGGLVRKLLAFEEFAVDYRCQELSRLDADFFVLARTAQTPASRFRHEASSFHHQHDVPTLELAPVRAISSGRPVRFCPPPSKRCATHADAAGRKGRYCGYCQRREGTSSVDTPGMRSTKHRGKEVSHGSATGENLPGNSPEGEKRTGASAPARRFQVSWIRTSPSMSIFVVRGRGRDDAGSAAVESAGSALPQDTSTDPTVRTVSRCCSSTTTVRLGLQSACHNLQLQVWEGVPLGQEDDVPQALLAQDPHEAFDMRAGVRGSVGDGKATDAQALVLPGVERAAVAPAR